MLKLQILLLVFIFFSGHVLAQTFLLGSYKSNGDSGNVTLANYKTTDQRIIHNKPAKYVEVDYPNQKVYFTALDGKIYSGALLITNQNQVIYSNTQPVIGLNLVQSTQKLYFFVNGTGILVLYLQTPNANPIFVYNTTDTPVDVAHSILNDSLYFITIDSNLNKTCYVCTLINDTCTNVNVIFNFTSSLNSGFATVSDTQSIWFFDLDATSISIYGINETSPIPSTSILIFISGTSGYQMIGFQKVTDYIFFTCLGCNPDPTLASVTLSQSTEIDAQIISGINQQISNLRTVSTTAINISNMSMINVSVIPILMALIFVLFLNYLL